MVWNDDLAKTGPATYEQIDETMLYVHVAENHRREIPDVILAAGNAEPDPDPRIIGMLGARGTFVPRSGAATDGNRVAAAA